MQKPIYIKEKKRYNSQLSIIDIVLIWGIILAPMTALRIFKYGPGEVLLIIWMLAVFIGDNHSTKYEPFSLPLNDISLYQLANLTMMFVGMIVNIFVYHGTVEIADAVVVFSTHFFMFLLSCCLFLYFEECPLEKIHKILSRIFVYGVFVYGVLLVYALYYDITLFGKSLWLGGRGYRFKGLANNPHQIGMITGSGLCFSLYLMSTSTRILNKILYFAATCGWFWISLSTRADTMTICYVLMGVFAVIILIPKITDNQEQRIHIYLALFITSGLAFALNTPKIWRAFTTFVSEAGNGLGRIELWKSGLSQFQEKIICILTGLGPTGGSGIVKRYSGIEVEAHNTYVQQIINSGIFICIYYIGITLKMIRRPLEKNTFLIMAVVYFLLYGFGGNMNRRVLVWFTYSMVLILLEKTKGTKISKK